MTKSDTTFHILEPENMKAVFDSIIDLIAVVARDRTIVWANRAMLQAFPQRPVIGEKCFEVLHATNLSPATCRTCDIFETGKPVSSDVFEPAIGGGWFNVSGYPVRDESGTVIQVIHSFRDISARKKQEEEIRCNEERYRRLIDSVTDAIAVFDRDWRVRLINPTNLALWRMSSEQVLGRSLMEVLPGIESTTIFLRLRMVMDERIPVVFSERFTFIEGHSGFFEFRLYPVPEGVMSIINNVTERWTAQNLLEASERRIKDVLENVQMIAVMLDRKGYITFTNRFFLELTGWGKEDVQQKDWFSLCIPPEVREETRRLFLDAFNNDLSHPSFVENEILTRSGERRAVCWNNTVLRDPGGTIVGAAGLGEDVTERNLTRRRLEEAKEKAEATTRAKSEFLSMMSHDIRNPMNGVLGFVDLLLLTSLDDEQREYVQTIKSSGESLLGLINDILDFSRIESGKIVLDAHIFNVREFVRETVRLFQSVAIGKSIRLSCEMDSSIPDFLVGDSLRFRQILQNLLGNALKFTPSGEVGLALSVMDGASSKRKSAIPSQPDEPAGEAPTWIRLRGHVRDTGIGIHPDRVAILFQPFAQAEPGTAREYGGSGLGLVISQRLCRLMHGKIEVESQLGRGSTFHFELCMQQADPDLQAPNRDERRAELRELGERMPLRILIVDDEPQNCRLTAGLLSQFGYKSRFAAEGSEALRLLKQEAFDVVFLDIRMDGLDGLETVRRLRNEDGASLNQHVWVCALTAYAMAHEREQCLAAGMDDFLAKPLGMNDLTGALERAWDGLRKKTS